MEFKVLKESLEKDKNYRAPIKTKKFLTTEEKFNYIDDMVEIAIKVEDNGISKINYMSKSLMSDILMVKYYSTLNLDSDIDIYEQYDLLLSKGVIASIKSKLQKGASDYEDLQYMIDETLEQEVRIANSVEDLVANGIYKLIDKIPNEEKMSEYIKEIGKFDPNKLGKIKDLFDFVTKK